ncbi:MAG TPA: hypothetical protein DIV86_07550 [Alphaproteobacteria bacterium]|nr:hypothetical protein [Alphaproteobacteria bacterium]
MNRNAISIYSNIAINEFKTKGDLISTLLTLVSKASELFEKANIEQKRKLIRFLFPNLKVTGEKLEYSLKKPFDLLINLPLCLKWRG